MAGKPPIINISGERVALGPVPDGLDELFAVWVADFATQRNLARAPRPRTPAQVRRSLDASLTDARAIVFAIYARDDWRLIGLTQLTDVDYLDAAAEFHITIGDPTDRGRGYGAEATRLTLDYAFTALGLVNVMLTVFAYNAAAIRAYEKAGFRTFGVRHASKFMGGRRWDTVYMQALAEQFEDSTLQPLLTPDAERPRAGG